MRAPQKSFGIPGAVWYNLLVNQFGALGGELAVPYICNPL